MSGVDPWFDFSPSQLGPWNSHLQKVALGIPKFPGNSNKFPGNSELELELKQTQMTQKPMLRAEVYARALRASQNRKEDSL